jgi:hypothetical protein
LLRNETVDNFIERPLSDRTAEKGTLGSEAAVLENVLLEHLSTTKPNQQLLVNHLIREIVAQHSPIPTAPLAGCGRVGVFKQQALANHILQQAASMASIFGRSWKQTLLHQGRSQKNSFMNVTR